MTLTKQFELNMFVTAWLLLSVVLYGQAQTAGIKGIVLSEKGEPLNGVSVVLKALSGKERLATTTNEKGVFQFTKLTTAVKYDFIFNYVGYQENTIKSFELKLKEENSLMVRMKEAPSKLTEVVVTALGVTSEKRKLGFSAQEIKSSDMAKTREANPLGSLVGKIAGLNIYNSGEMRSAPAFDIRGQQPLVVVNGVPFTTDFWDINADDIESINVLKGTAASALYGSRGKDGAIMITIKRGAASREMVEVEFKTNTMFQKGFIAIPKTQKRYGSGADGIYTLTEFVGDNAHGDAGGGAGSWGPKLDAGNLVVQWDSPVDPVTGKRTPTPWVSRGKNNLNNFIRSGAITSNNLSVSRNFDKGSMRMSLSQMYQKGQVPNTQLNIIGFSVAGTYNLSPKLKADVSLNYNRQFTKNYPFAGYGRKNSIYNILIWEGADTDIRDFKNYWQPGREGLSQLWYNYTEYNNPWFVAKEYLRSLSKDVIYGNFSLSYDIAPGFNITARAAVNSSARFQDLKVPFSFQEYSGKTYSFGLNGGYQTENQNTLDFNTDILATYHKRMGSHTSLNVIAGANIRYFQDREQGLKADGLNVPGLYSFANAANPLLRPTADVNFNDATTNYLSKKQVNSWYMSADLSLYKGLYWGITGRLDKSSTMPVNNNTYFYPSTSLAWVVSDVVKMPEVISFAKVRASLAQVASDLGIYDIVQSYDPGLVWNGNTSVNMTTALKNQNILPQTTTTAEYGTELHFFRNRISFDFTYFRSVDKNTIIDLPISQAAGFASHKENANRYLRNGVEITISGSPVKGKDFTWNTSLNWSTYKQTIKELDASLKGNLNGLLVGDRTDKILSGSYLYAADGQLIVGTNGMPVRDPNKQFFGYSKPDWSAGLSNKFTYKSFVLSIDIDGRFGGTIYSTTKEKMISAGVDPVTNDEFQRDQYNQGIASALIQGVVVTTDASGNKLYTPNTKKISWYDYNDGFLANSRSHSLWYKGSFVKLREVSMTYLLPVTKILHSFFKEATVSVVGRNLLLISDMQYVDPDSGVDNLQTPTSRMVGFNLNLKF